MFINLSGKRAGIRVLLLFSITLMLGACASPFKADVTRFHTNPVANGQAILIEPEDAALHGLEFNRYADLIGAKLAQIGYSPAGDNPPALIVRLNYGIINLGEQEKDSGASIGVGVGRHGGNTGFGLGTVFGLSGDDDTVYERFLTMVLNDAGTGERLFEGRAVSQGPENDLAAIMPLLVTALFENYPGQSGKTETITIKTDD